MRASDVVACANVVGSSRGKHAAILP